MVYRVGDVDFEQFTGRAMSGAQNFMQKLHVLAGERVSPDDIKRIAEEVTVKQFKT